MNTKIAACVVATATLVGCGGAAMSPAKLAESESSIRGADELGADELPTAGLYLKLAKDHLAQAKQLSAGGNGEDADRMLSRAQVDADLAIALAHEDSAREEARGVDAAIAEEKGRQRE